MTRVLVVDDDPDIRTFLRISLELHGYEVSEATNGALGVRAALDRPPDLILMDVMMPELDGVAAVTQLRADARTSHLPIILVTARSAADDKIAGLTAGADDYVTKPFDTNELHARISAMLKRNTEMRSLSPLTGLPGNPRIQAELLRRHTSGEDFALLYADLNHFKAFNDHYGFLRGDAAIRRCATLIVECATAHGDGNFVGHVGGDDFVVFSGLNVAEAIASDIAKGIDELAPSLYDKVDREAGSIVTVDRPGQTRRFGLLSIAIGITTTDLGPVDHPEELVELATEMKRHAKGIDDEGRSTWAFDRRIRGAGSA
jgi:diguanylate cyclase (GGDEF)-like protein